MNIKDIQRTKDRIRATGEVFTPLNLVDEILDKLPAPTWESDKTFVDPSCGDGNFLVRVVAYKIHKGATVEQALSTTYGVELMEDNAKWCRLRVLAAAFTAQAYLKQNSDVLPHMTFEDEVQLLESAEIAPFIRKYASIVENNIICHNSLTYCYRFGDAADVPRPESVGKCECDLCTIKVSLIDSVFEF